MLIEGKKFDFRLYFMLTGVDEFRAFFSYDGLARLCTEDYKQPNFDEEQDKKTMMSHLTNFSLNQKSEKFRVHQGEDGEYGNGFKRHTKHVFKLYDDTFCKDGNMPPIR